MNDTYIWQGAHPGGSTFWQCICGNTAGSKSSILQHAAVKHRDSAIVEGTPEQQAERRRAAEMNVLSMQVQVMRLQAEKEGEIKALKRVLDLVKSEFTDRDRWMANSHNYDVSSGAAQLGDKLVKTIEQSLEILALVGRESE